MIFSWGQAQSGRCTTAKATIDNGRTDFLRSQKHARESTRPRVVAQFDDEQEKPLTTEDTKYHEGFGFQCLSCFRFVPLVVNLVKVSPTAPRRLADGSRRFRYNQ